MACPAGQIIAACDFPQFWVDQTPKFDELIVRDITPADSWLYNVSTGTQPVGTPVEVTQDRFRGVWPNTTKKWNRAVANGLGCTGNPCDPPESLIGVGADRRTWYAEEQTWATGLFCYNQDMHITHAREHIRQLIGDILKPATIAISSSFLRKRALQWADTRWTASAAMTPFTFQWESGADPTEEIYLDTSADPTTLSLLTPQMLQRRFSPLMRAGYAGQNPFRETLPFIELVADLDTCWQLDKLGAQPAVTAGAVPNITGNWRFEQWGAANAYWRYGYSGQLGNYLVRTDELNLRFNYITDLGAGAHGANGNRYRYQIVLPYVNAATTGAGGAAGIGRTVHPDFDAAQFCLSFIMHKMGMQLLTSEATPLNPQMPYGMRDFGGRWQWQQHDLGADSTGVVIANPWQNKGRFAAWFKYYVRPLHTEFMEAIFHMREQPCVVIYTPCSPDPGYPPQSYSSTPPDCD